MLNRHPRRCSITVTLESNMGRLYDRRFPASGPRENDMNSSNGHFMLFASCMQKSGSGWFVRMANDLMVTAGHDDSRTLKLKYPRMLRLVSKDFDAMINRPSAWRMRILEHIRSHGNTFVVKTHRGPSPTVIQLKNKGSLRALYQFRDPRDALLSAAERGARNRAKGAKRSILRLGQYKSFAKLMSIEDAIEWARDVLIPVWEAWQKYPGVHMVRYEDLLADTIGELRKLSDFIGFDATDEQLKTIDGHYRRDETRSSDPNLHFNKGVAGRFAEKFTPSQMEMCKRVLGEYIERMGYAW